MAIKAYSYIRLSSKGQIEGGGERRQLELVQDYAARHGLELDDSIRDLGKSGYHNDHVKTGALGRFLALIGAGKVERGSYLLVENLDRLSRQIPIDAVSQFILILQAGIKVVTISDNQVYEHGRDFTQLIIALATMSRGHEESAIKQERAKAAVMARKRDALQGKPRFNTSLVKWIDQTRINGFDYQFKLNAHADTVRRIFELADSGLGTVAIARVLNQTNTPMLTKNGKKDAQWRDIQVGRILKNEMTIGTYHVTEEIDGVDVSLGEPIKNYYPAAISEELFWRVQRNRHKDPKGGRIGTRFTNLFADMTACSECGARLKMHHSPSGNKLTYYTCSNRFSGGPCTSPSKLFPYKPLEQAILDNVREFHLASHLGIERTKAKRSQIAESLAQAETALADLKSRQDNLFEMAQMANDKEVRVKLLSDMSSFRVQIETQSAMVSEYKGQIDAIDDESKQIADISETIQMERLSWTTGDEHAVLASRSKVSQALREFITTIQVNFFTQTALVYVGGYSRMYQFNRNGELMTTVNGLNMPFSEIERVMRSDKLSDDEIAKAKQAYAKLNAAG